MAVPPTAGGERAASRARRRTTAARAASRLTALLLLAALLASLAGCDRISPRHIGQRRIAQLLQEMVGPADRYQVRIHEEGDTDLFEGRISRLTVVGHNVKARGGLTLAQVEGELTGVRFNRRRESLESALSSVLTATVTSDAAIEYLNSRGSLSDVRIEFLEGKVKLEARRSLPAGLSLPFALEGDFELRGPRKVHFIPDSLSVARLRLPGPVLSFIERRINPVFDIDTLGLPLDLDSVAVQPGRALLVGHLVIPPGGLSAAERRPRER